MCYKEGVVVETKEDRFLPGPDGGGAKARYPMSIIRVFLTATDAAMVWPKGGGAVILTLLFIVSACSGGGGGKPLQQGVAGVSGQVCIDGDEMSVDASYTISLSGAAAVPIQTESFLLKDYYTGSIGGQIRAVEKFNVSPPEEDLLQLITWGMGGSIRYGTPTSAMGTATLSHRGAVTSLARLRVGTSPMLVYGSESGVGLVAIGSDGQPVDQKASFRPVPARSGPISGVLSVAAKTDGSLIAFTTADGLLLTTSATALQNGERCAEVLSASDVLKVSDTDATITYLPVKVEVGKDHAYVLAKATGAVPSIAPSYEEAYTPYFQGALINKSPAIVRAVSLGDHTIYEVGFATADGSFKKELYDNFIPTGIDFDGDALFVVGLAYKQTLVQAFLAEKCGSAASQLQCLLDAAKDSTLVTYEQNGLHPFAAGFFTYRDTGDFSVADHFEAVPVSVFAFMENAPPFIFQIAAEGGTGYIRGPNFLLPFARNDSASGKENWVLGEEMDAVQGLVPGLPNDVMMCDAGVATSVTALREGVVGYSALIGTDEEGQFIAADTGAIYVRVEGGGTASGGGMYVAAIEMGSADGGMLYLENGSTRTPIAITGAAGGVVSHADYDGATLAYAWTSVGSSNTEQPWRIAVQRGSDSSSKAELQFSHNGTGGIFDGFPQSSATLSPNEARGVTDVMLLAKNSGWMVVLFGGKSGGTRYYQPALFSFTPKNSGAYGKPVLRGVMTALSKPGTHEGRILKVTANNGGSFTVYFSAADGIYQWTVMPGGASGEAEQVFAVPGLIDASNDPSSTSKVASVAGFNVVVRGLSAGSQPITMALPKNSSTSKSKAEGARVAVMGNYVFVASPYGTTTAPFYIYDLSKPTQAPMTCSTCSFVDVNVFEADPRFVLASSISSGIEIYKLGN